MGTVREKKLYLTLSKMQKALLRTKFIDSAHKKIRNKQPKHAMREAYFKPSINFYKYTVNVLT